MVRWEGRGKFNGTSRVSSGLAPINVLDDDNQMSQLQLTMMPRYKFEVCWGGIRTEEDARVIRSSGDLADLYSHDFIPMLGDHAQRSTF